MGRIEYVGLPSKLYGKHLMKLLANLKDFGVGRMFTRGSLERFPEPTFYIVTKVKPAMDPDVIWGDVHAHEYFRCVYTGNRIIESYLPDFRLVHKADEQKYLDQIIKDPPVKILPREKDLPPLLKTLLRRDMENRGVEFDPNMKLLLHYSAKAKDLHRRVAEPGETPSFTIDMNKCPLEVEELKQGVNYDI